jgi:hypothetical protein
VPAKTIPHNAVRSRAADPSGNSELEGIALFSDAFVIQRAAPIGRWELLALLKGIGTNMFEHVEVYIANDSAEDSVTTGGADDV